MANFRLKILSFVVVASALLAVCGSLHAAVALPFVDDFEDGVFDSAYTVGQKNDAVATEADGVFTADDNDSGQNIRWLVPFEVTAAVEVAVDVRPVSGDKHRWFVQSGPDKAAEVLVFEDGRLQVLHGEGGVMFPGTVSADAFTTVKLVVDAGSDRFRVFAGGDELGDGFATLGTTDFTSFDSFEYQSGSTGPDGGEVRFDNLSIAVPEPGSMAMLGLPALLLLRRKAW